jgi:hypothetical protein
MVVVKQLQEKDSRNAVRVFLRFPKSEADYSTRLLRCLTTMVWGRSCVDF